MDTNDNNDYNCVPCDGPLIPGGSDRGTSDLDEIPSDCDCLSVAGANSHDSPGEEFFSVMCAFGNGVTASRRSPSRRREKYRRDLDLKSSFAHLVALHDTSQDTIDVLRRLGSSGDPDYAEYLRGLDWPGLSQEARRAYDRGFVEARPTYDFLVEAGDGRGRTMAVAARSSFCETLITIFWEVRASGVPDRLVHELAYHNSSRIQIVRVCFKVPVSGMRECVLANVSLYSYKAAQDLTTSPDCLCLPSVHKSVQHMHAIF